MKMHRRALDAAVKAAGAKLTAADKPLIELARALADQVDAAGPDGPGTRLAGTYLTTLRTLQARMGLLEKSAGTGKLAELRSVVGGDS